MDDLLKADGFDKAIIGVGRKKGSQDSLVYSYDKCIQILMERDGMEYDDAVEFMEFNVVDAYVGERTPIFVQTDEEFKNSHDGIFGFLRVDEIQYPAIFVENKNVFNSITFKTNFLESYMLTLTFEKIALSVGITKDCWVFYNARIAMIPGSKYGNEEFVMIYDFCEKKND